MNDARIAKTQAALDNALVVLHDTSSLESLGVFFAKLFAKSASSENLTRLREVVGRFSDDDWRSAQEVNRVASDIAGVEQNLGNRQIAALKRFFFDVYYAPIVPIEGDDDRAFAEFYARLFSSDRSLSALQDLQRQVGDFWANGSSAREHAILDKLRVLGPDVAWDARHVFALINLLTLDLNMKQLAPFEASGSLW